MKTKNEIYWQRKVREIKKKKRLEKHYSSCQRCGGKEYNNAIDICEFCGFVRSNNPVEDYSLGIEMEERTFNGRLGEGFDISNAGNIGEWL